MTGVVVGEVVSIEVTPCCIVEVISVVQARILGEEEVSIVNVEVQVEGCFKDCSCSRTKSCKPFDIDCNKGLRTKGFVDSCIGTFDSTKEWSMEPKAMLTLLSSGIVS